VQRLTGCLLREWIGFQPVDRFARLNQRGIFHWFGGARGQQNGGRTDRHKAVKCDS